MIIIRKLYIVRTTREFNDIIENGNCIKNKCFVIHYLNNNLPYDRFGISVSKKLGNAVFRNKYKRKMRSIIDNYKKNYQKNMDYIIIIKSNYAEGSFLEIKESFENMIFKMNKGFNKETK